MGQLGATGIERSIRWVMGKKSNAGQGATASQNDGNSLPGEIDWHGLRGDGQRSDFSGGRLSPCCTFARLFSVAFDGALGRELTFGVARRC